MSDKAAMTRLTFYIPTKQREILRKYLEYGMVTRIFGLITTDLCDALEKEGHKYLYHNYYGRITVEDMENRGTDNGPRGTSDIEFGPDSGDKVTPSD